jgi:phage terminase large subunit-like protein
MATATEVSEIQARASAAKYGDLTTYAKAVHGLDLELYQAAWEQALESLNRVVIVCPPDTYKSTTVRLFVEKLIGSDPNSRTLWLMGTAEQATKQVMDVGGTIKGNNVYRLAFGVEEDAEKQWTNTVLFVKRSRFGPDPTLMATGIDGPYQGLHFDLIVIDDPTTPKDVRSPTEMEAQRHMIRGMILDRLAEGGRIVVILTRWGENDLVPTFEEMRFTIITMPVVGDYPWGTTLSPTRFPDWRVDEIRQDKGDVLFSLTYMCSPQAMQGNLIQRDTILYWDSDNLPVAPMSLFMGIDPAASRRTYADYSCIATVGLDLKTGKKYLLDLWTKRVEVPDLRTEIIKRAKRTAGLRAIGLETAGFQLGLMQDLKRQNNLPMAEVPYRTRRQVMHKASGIDRDKASRALYLASQFTSGRLYIPSNLPLVEGISFESELCTIPLSKHDDRMDAVAIACALADSVRPSSRGMKVSIRGF